MSLGLIPLGTRPLGLGPEVAAGGGASYTLTCAAGSYTISGAGAGLIAAHNMTAAQGVYAITGNPVAMRAAHGMAAEAGAYSITGQPAALKAGHRLICAPGSYTITGSPVVTPDDGMANEYTATIMRESIINKETTALLDSIARQAGTMSATINRATIMRADAENLAGTMRANDTNLIAELL